MAKVCYFLRVPNPDGEIDYHPVDPERLPRETASLLFQRNSGSGKGASYVSIKGMEAMLTGVSAVDDIRSCIADCKAEALARLSDGCAQELFERLIGKLPIDGIIAAAAKGDIGRAKKLIGTAFIAAAGNIEEVAQQIQTLSSNSESMHDAYGQVATALESTHRIDRKLDADMNSLAEAIVSLHARIADAERDLHVSLRQVTESVAAMRAAVADDNPDIAAAMVFFTSGEVGGFNRRSYMARQRGERVTAEDRENAARHTEACSTADDLAGQRWEGFAGGTQAATNGATEAIRRDCVAFDAAARKFREMRVLLGVHEDASESLPDVWLAAGSIVDDRNSRPAALRAKAESLAGGILSQLGDGRPSLSQTVLTTLETARREIGAWSRERHGSPAVSRCSESTPPVAAPASKFQAASPKQVSDEEFYEVMICIAQESTGMRFRRATSTLEKLVRTATVLGFRAAGDTLARMRAIATQPGETECLVLGASVVTRWRQSDARWLYLEETDGSKRVKLTLKSEPTAKALMAKYELTADQIKAARLQDRSAYRGKIG